MLKHVYMNTRCVIMHMGVERQTCVYTQHSFKNQLDRILDDWASQCNRLIPLAHLVNLRLFAVIHHQD